MGVRQASQDRDSTPLDRGQSLIPACGRRRTRVWFPAPALSARALAFGPETPGKPRLLGDSRVRVLGVTCPPSSCSWAFALRCRDVHMYGHQCGWPSRTHSSRPINVSRGQMHASFTEKMESVQSALNKGGGVEGGQEGQSSGSAGLRLFCASVSPA